EYFGLLALLGIVIGFCAVGFHLLLVKTQKFLDKKTKQFPFWARLVSIFVLTGITGLLLTDAITGGHDLIEKIASLDFAIVALLVLLVVKLFLIAVCYNSGATGGLFVPTLCIGALVGGICGHLMIMLGMPSDLYATIVCISMMGFLSGTTHAPISALVLLIEISGFSGNLLSSGIVIILAFVVALIIRRKSLFEEQVDRIVENLGQKEEGVSISKTLKIGENSVLIGKRVSDIFLPKFVDISSVVRKGRIIVSDSETRIHPDDKIEFIYQQQNAEEIEKYLDDVTR
ncbi:MAG: chloride channel protein, partial [Clostridia bacterium]|nr:chloride channel protein [Clostridia bacterium]